MPGYVEVCAADELKEGETHAVEVDGQAVCVVRVPEGVFAFDDVCPHRGAALSEGKLTGTTLMCAAHTWEFDVTSGALLRLRAPACLSMRDARETDDGRIEVSTEVRAPQAASRGGRQAA